MARRRSRERDEFLVRARQRMDEEDVEGALADLEEALFHPSEVQLRYLAAAHERLASELFPILRVLER